MDVTIHLISLAIEVYVACTHNTFILRKFLILNSIGRNLSLKALPRILMRGDYNYVENNSIFKTTSVTFGSPCSWVAGCRLNGNGNYGILIEFSVHYF